MLSNLFTHNHATYLFGSIVTMSHLFLVYSQFTQYSIQKNFFNRQISKYKQ